MSINSIHNHFLFSMLGAAKSSENASFIFITSCVQIMHGRLIVFIHTINNRT